MWDTNTDTQWATIDVEYDSKVCILMVESICNYLYMITESMQINSLISNTQALWHYTTCKTIITLSLALHKSMVSITPTQYLIVWLCMEHIPYVCFTLPYVCFILPCVLVLIPCVTSNSSTCSLPFTTFYVSALSIYKHWVFVLY